MEWIGKHYKNNFTVYSILVFIINLSLVAIILFSIIELAFKIGSTGIAVQLSVNFVLYLILGFIVVVILSIFSFGHRRTCLQINQKLDKIIESNKL